MAQKITTYSRDFWADALRVLSIFMVVTIHTTAQVLYYWREVSILSWQFANILNSISRISVPVFVMLSGAYLLSKKENAQTFLTIRIPRIILPWFFWGTVQLIIQNDFSLSILLSKGLATTVLQNYVGGFWFMPMILGIYLLTPIIKPYIQKATTYEWKYLFSLWILFASIIPTLNEVGGINISVNLPNWTQYLGYFIAGYYFTHKIKITEQIKKQIYSLFFMSVAVIILGTTAITLQNNYLFEGLYSYTNIFVLTASLCGYIFFKDLFEKITKRNFLSAKQFKKIKPKIETISKASFGIFLSHAIFLELYKTGKLGFTFHSLSLHPLIAIPITTVLVFFSSLVFILGIKKVAPKLERVIS